jgi:hypothetical protein
MRLAGQARRSQSARRILRYKPTEKITQRGSRLAGQARSSNRALQGRSGNAAVTAVTREHHPRPPACHDGDCQRVACRWYREGYEDGYGAGYAGGFDEGRVVGYSEGYAAGYAAGKGS